MAKKKAAVTAGLKLSKTRAAKRPVKKTGAAARGKTIKVPHVGGKPKTKRIFAPMAIVAYVAVIALAGLLSSNKLKPQVLGLKVSSQANQITDANLAGIGSEFTNIGVYYWGGLIEGTSPAGMFTKSREMVSDLGLGTVRIALSAKSDMDYDLSNSCINSFTLAKLASRADFKAVLADPNFSTVIITAYDGASFPDCQTHHYLNPAFFTTANTSRIENEYTDLANFLKQFDKTFIINTWESDNELYCGYAYGATPGSCPGIEEKIEAYTQWVRARTDGIRAAGAGNVFSAMEFANVHSLEDQGMPSSLNNIVPAVDVDYYSYSSYESINVSTERTADDIDYIRGKLSSYGKDPGSLFLGEIGFDALSFGQEASAERLYGVLNVAREKNIPYAIVWNLIDNPGFGVYDSRGELTGYGQAITRAPEPGPSVIYIDAVQGYNSGTGQYTDFFGFDNEYLILYGQFAEAHNRVYINDIPFTILYDSPNQINVKLDNSRLAGLQDGLQAEVVVAAPDGSRTQGLNFTLMPEYVILGAQGYNSLTGEYTNGEFVNDQYIMLYGNFAGSGNTINIAGVDFAPIYETSALVMAKVDQGRVYAQDYESLPVYVHGGYGSTPSVLVTFQPAQ